MLIGAPQSPICQSALQTAYAGLANLEEATTGDWESLDMSNAVNMESYMMWGQSQDNPMGGPTLPSTLRRRHPVVNPFEDSSIVLDEMLANQTEARAAVASTPVSVTEGFTPQTTLFTHGEIKESPVGSDTIHHQKASPNHEVAGRFGKEGDAVASMLSMTDQELKGYANLKRKIPDGQGSQGDASMDPRRLLHKKVFLSYSGSQKQFVEQLYVDLKNAGYFPFFDQDFGSLPKGEEFPGRVLEAARNCHVAVIVLSHDYLHSKWPMIELSEFVKVKQSVNPKIKILPLFYALEVSVLKDVVARRKLLDKWTEFANKDSRIALPEWIEAIDTLRRINGVVFRGGSEVNYRSAILTSLYRLCCPDVKFKLPNMDGEERWCKIIEHELEIEKIMEANHPLIGLYGMGGLGKTLLCKALCNYFHERFNGKVCYVDFSSGNSVKMKKEILTRLTEMDRTLLDTVIHEEECDRLLEIFLPQQDVFLAIDNLCLSRSSDAGRISKSLAQVFGSLSTESMSIVTSRSLETLKKALRIDTTHMCMPGLTEDEAMNIFIRVALPSRTLQSLPDDELEVVKTCLSRCAFLYNLTLSEKLQSTASHVYHPMAIRALGYSMMRVNPSDPIEWVRQEKIPEKLADGDLDEIYKILKEGYDTLDDTEKLLFMDIAVFAPREKLWDLSSLWEWLKGIHNINQRDLVNKLRKLETMSLLEIRKGSVKLHDLYKEFASYELEIGAESRRCVYMTEGDSLPWCLESTAPGGCWPNLKRVKLHSSRHADFESMLWCYISEDFLCLRIPGEKLREWANLQVLYLEFGGNNIDIGPLKCLRALVLIADQNLKTFTCSNHLEQLRFVKFTCMFAEVNQVPTFSSPRLQELEMSFNMGSLQRPFTLPLGASALTVLRVFRWYSSRQNEVLNLEQFPLLTELYINSMYPDHGLCRLSLSGLGLNALTKLRKLYLRSIPIEGPLLGLQNLVSLETLEVRLCYKIRSLPGLGSLTNLKVLNVSGTPIEDLDGVEQLMKLEDLLCVNCKCLRHLPDLSSLPHLWILYVKGCDLLERYSVSENCTVAGDWEQQVPQVQRPDDWLDVEHVMASRRQTLRLTEDERAILENIRTFAQQNDDVASKTLQDPSIIARLKALDNQRAKHRSWHILGDWADWLRELTFPCFRYQIKYYIALFSAGLAVFFIMKMWSFLFPSSGNTNTLLFIIDFVVEIVVQGVLG